MVVAVETNGTISNRFGSLGVGPVDGHSERAKALLKLAEKPWRGSVASNEEDGSNYTV